MPTRVFAFLVILGFLTACAPKRAIVTPNPVATETSTPAQRSATATPKSETVASAEVPAPSYRVGAFYYPWYGNPEKDGKWIHWIQNNHAPPNDIASDYFPALGAYSSNDPAVVEQHMKWLRQARIGVIISSWWGQGSREDQAVPLLLKTAEQYDIKVAFHIEPYRGRTAERLVSDIQYLYEKYGSSPAFFRSMGTSRYSPSDEPKGMFFVWSIGAKGAEGQSVQADYWRDALDSIHALSEGALIIANSTQTSSINDGHFDGLYNYATLHLEESNGFDWARSMPPDSLYVPSVIPGFSAKRVGYADTTYVPRKRGSTFETQWGAALGTGVEPAMITITSFNEWHEGTMIEPPQFEVDDHAGYSYEGFEGSPPEMYLYQTQDWIDRFLARTGPRTYRMRIQITTTSDWTTLDILENGRRIKPAWIRPERVSVSESAVAAGFEAGDRLLLTQSLSDANAGKEVQMTWDVMLTYAATGYDLILQIDRGDIGKTQVSIYNFLGEVPIEVKTVEWDQVTTERNSHQFTIPFDWLITPNP